MNRINIICLGVRDMLKALRFYRDGLGLLTDETDEDPSVVFFNNNGTKLELYPLKLLAQDIDEKEPPTIGTGFGGITLAYNAKSKKEVDQVMELARNAGAKIVKELQDAFWGGYHGYFADLDGYYWEVAYAPGFEFDERDMLIF